MAKVSTDGRTVKEASKITLSSDEDAPMTLAVDRAVSWDVSPVELKLTRKVKADRHGHQRLVVFGSGRYKRTMPTILLCKRAVSHGHSEIDHD